MLLSDGKARTQALNIHKSFIVQAPAGSGKTGVLTQRILKLLTIVERPEEILGITFTKKAAAEMRTRVMEALQMGDLEQPPKDPYERQFYELAREVNLRDQKKHWGLRQNLSRLRLVTIDSFCSSVVRNRPLTSGLGLQFDVTEDASELYAEASKALLHSLDDDNDFSNVLANVLSYLDNNYGRFESLITQMLMNRDHWLADVISVHGNIDAFKTLLESSLERLNEQVLESAQHCLGDTLFQEIKNLAIYAENQLALSKAEHSLLANHNSEYDYLKQALSLFFTKDLTKLRSRFDKNVGFPVGTTSVEKKECKAYKQQAEAVVGRLGELGQHGHNTLLDFITLPSPLIEPEQWHLLEDLMMVVRYGAAHLKLAFQNKKTIDFSEVALAALAALGECDSPTEIALLLDEVISHILVDEFQDTSILQVDLLEKLTAGWTPGDGRTLFLVGDPMQSIYSFRKADVGLFLKLWQDQHLGDVPIEPLLLDTNFRSSPEVIQWINETFQQAFPARVDIRKGAVPYSQSKAAKPAQQHSGVVTQLFWANTESEEESQGAQAEANYIVDVIKKTKKDRQSIAILAKGKSHILDIVVALRSARLPFQAVDMEPLTSSQLIIDLLNVIRAYQSPNDRTAWFGILRGPWCGLTLAELTEIASVHDCPWTLLELVLQSKDSTLSAQTQQKLQHVYSVFSKAHQRRNKGRWPNQVRELVLELGLPATASDYNELEAARLFFEILEDVNSIADTPDIEQFLKRLENLYVPPQTQTGEDTPIQIMTMHKSKGLEFDMVFLPQLQRQSRHDDRPLILVDKQTSLADSYQELFIAPIDQNGDSEGSSIYTYLWQQQKQRLNNEIYRLLYVACTRAKSTLYLTGCVKQDAEGEIKPPNPKSLLGVLWPTLGLLSPADVMASDAAPTPEYKAYFRQPEPDFLANLKTYSDVQKQTGQQSNELNAINTTITEEDSENTSYQRLAGTLFHELMEHISEQPQQLDDIELTGYSEHWRVKLELQGLAEQSLENALELLVKAAHQIKESRHRDWLFAPHYTESYSELVLNQWLDNDVKQWVVDRTFTDGGTRYIIDYKLTRPKDGQSITEFSQQEAGLYKTQLDNYAKVMNDIKQSPTRTYLYFPLIDHLHEVER